MNKKSRTSKDAADKLVRGIKRKTRKRYSAEEKIRIVCLVRKQLMMHNDADIQLSPPTYHWN